LRIAVEHSSDSTYGAPSQSKAVALSAPSSDTEDESHTIFEPETCLHVKTMCLQMCLLKTLYC
ncbi:hypothetical protein CEXT_595981, partial [Caerostris extrusa]